MNDLPRRNYIDQLSPAEAAIREAKQLVEMAGCDPLLTEAVNLLSRAQEKVADFIDFELAKHKA